MRGLNKPIKKREIGDSLKKHQICLADLLETKVKHHKFLESSVRYANGCALMNHYGNTANGRIWFIWKEADVSLLY